MKSSKVYQWLIYCSSLAGFLYQSIVICQEYFKYPTITSVKVIPALPLTNLPQVAFCYDLMFGDKRSSIDIFEMLLKPSLWPQKPTRDGGFLWGMPGISFSHLLLREKVVSSRGGGVSGSSSERPKMTLFLQRGRACFSIKTRHPTQYTPSELFKNPSMHSFHVGVRLNYPFTGTIFNVVTPLESRPNQTKLIYGLYMTSYESGFSDPRLSPIAADEGYWNNLFVDLTYSQRITYLAHPPYDTNCRDYKKSRLESQRSCVEQCINEFTVNKYGRIFDDHMIERDFYVVNNETRDEYLINRPKQFQLKFPYTIPSVVKDHDKNVEYFEQRSQEHFLSVQSNCAGGSRSKMPHCVARTFEGNYYKQLATMHADVKRAINHCEEISCPNPDCETEYVIPATIRTTREPHEKKSSIISLRVGLFPAREPVIIVTSSEKLMFIDYIVYLLSCLSFWFGFCPLSMSDWRSREWKDSVNSYMKKMRLAMITQLQITNVRLNRILFLIRNTRVGRVRPFVFR